jgi:hypothetical protein
MPSLKTTESRNSYKGVRKLSKKTSKKGSKTNKKNKNTDDNTTEEMMDILNSDTNKSYTGKKHANQAQKNEEYDPLLVSNIGINKTSRIASLLGHIGNDIQQLGGPPIDPNERDTEMPEPMPSHMMGQMPHQMPQHMMGQMPHQMMSQLSQQMMGQMPQQMPQQMAQQMPQQMSHQMPQQMEAPQMNQQISNSIDAIKSLASLGSGIPRLI